MRAQFNRIVVAIGLVVVLPIVAIVGHFRPDAGRRFAVRAIKSLSGICGVRFEAHGLEHLDGQHGHVLVPNHASPIDIAAVLATCPDVQFVAAAELVRIPLLRSAMRAIGTVPIRRDHHESAHQQVDDLAQQTTDGNLVVFPEGGIPAAAGVSEFKTGAFVIAIGRGVPVVPVAIQGAARALPRRGRLLVRPAQIRVDVLEPIATTGLTVDDRRALADRAREAIVTSLGAAAVTPAER